MTWRYNFSASSLLALNPLGATAAPGTVLQLPCYPPSQGPVSATGLAPLYFGGDVAYLRVHSQHLGTPWGSARQGWRAVGGCAGQSWHAERRRGMLMLGGSAERTRARVPAPCGRHHVCESRPELQHVSSVPLLAPGTSGASWPPHPAPCTSEPPSLPAAALHRSAAVHWRQPAGGLCGAAWCHVSIWHQRPPAL